MANEEGERRKFSIDQRLFSVYQSVLYGLGEKIEQALEAHGLADPNGDPQLPLTESGADVLAEQFITACSAQFSLMDVNALKGFSLEKDELTESFIQGTGDPHIHVTQKNTILIEFPGPKPLIKQMEIPLDADNAQVLDYDQNGDPVYTFINLGRTHRVFGIRTIPPASASQTDR